MRYADIVIDNRTDSTDRPYTYALGEISPEKIRPGSKVYVPFAKSRKLREGYVLSVSGEDEIDPRIRSRIRSIDHVDEDVSLTEESVRTSLWMRERYVCRCIDALRCFTPAGKKRTRSASAEAQSGETMEERSLDIAFTGRVISGGAGTGGGKGARGSDGTGTDDPQVSGSGEKTLTEEQAAALKEIREAIDSGEHRRFLLYGVTGSGKTEVYIRSVKETLERGRTAIVLVPEISLTPQIIQRFQEVFGEGSIATVHSKLTERKRYEQWQRIRSGEVKIVIGARSAVFAPVSDLGLIIIDEEHEATYKSDFTPKYDTAEVAFKRLADRDNRGVLILGSATPSVASFSRAKQGIYQLLTMRKRYNEVELPQVTVVDMRQELREGNRSMISRQLYEQMERQLHAGRQIMLMQNRRGYSTFISCRECGHVAVCPECGVSLTYHRSSGKLTCHYCGRQQDAPKVCPECGSRFIRYFGSGTEKVEETVRQLFPGYQTDRIDLDSVSRKGELTRRLKAFGKGETNILIGTQMIAKGLDFRNVGLVGIVAADLPLNIPDFRSPERAFQLITQAAGRAGRGDIKGSVVIQTYHPEHYAITFSAAQNYDGFFEEESEFRRLMNYPPFSDMIQVLFTAKDEETAEAGAQSWYDRLRSMMLPEDRQNVFTPQQAYISRIKGVYRYSMVLRCPGGKRKEYAQMLRRLKEEDVRDRRQYLAVVDINPYSFA